ncbi:MAG: UbiA family prenyltransferase [Gemmatimonadetes bacterium]|nr:UbiA family prenyltransferase [Gemmatimonadota bacterium]
MTHRSAGVSLAAPLPPLCVDLDGTLVATDLFWEALVAFLRQRPASAWRVPLWLLRGRAFLKQELTRRVPFEPADLPYREEVLGFLREQRAAGRELILATAADRAAAERVAAHLGLFSGVLASDGQTNLIGPRKLEALERLLGERGFDYVGDAAADLPVWRAAREPVLVAPSWRVRRLMRREAPGARLLSPRAGGAAALFRALRPHQWVKNFLLFVPLLLAHQLGEPDMLLRVGLAFLAFSLCASGAYVTNDLLDLQHDRRHPRKRRRPFAAGLLSIPTGLLTGPLLVAAGFAVAALISRPSFLAALGVYLVLTSAYSLWLRQVLILDVLVLAGLYTIRLLAGGMAAAVPVSPWTLAFAVFLFFSLAFVKRYSELRALRATEQARANGRDYGIDDLPLLASIGPASGYLAVLVLALYINSNEVGALYRHPQVLWLVGPCLLYWITRLWFLAHRGELPDDPVVFALEDRVSYVIGGIVSVLVLLAT